MDLHMANYGLTVEAMHTYKITISGTLPLALQEQGNASPTQQYLVFQLSPNNAVLEVDGQLWEVGPDGTAMKFVDFGTYSYRVQAPNYLPKTGKVTVDDPNNTKTEVVRLKSDFVEVTLKVDADAEIWVNNEKKGTRTWTGPLGKGTYKIECKKEGYVTTMISKEITTEMNEQTITLPAPTPIYGSLNVESTPIGATIYIDGKEVGKTPKAFDEILVGWHELKLIKDGYLNYSDTLNINKDEKRLVAVDLDCRDDNTNVPEGGLNGLFSVSQTKQIWFSKGNLQYQSSTDTWRFAENQWDIIGGGNKNISSSYSGWIDLFGWGTGINPTESSAKYEDYFMFIDWGRYNAISNGGNQPGQWRTMSDYEWQFVLNKRDTKSGIRYVFAIVNNVKGVILLPDDWLNTYFPLNPNNTSAGFNINIISNEQWTTLERYGAVFLPAAGYRMEHNVYCVDDHGLYWAATDGGRAYARQLKFYINTVEIRSWYRDYGQSVRLVQDYQQ
jgi:hypothetical protein